MRGGVRGGVRGGLLESYLCSSLNLRSSCFWQSGPSAAVPSCPTNLCMTDTGNSHDGTVFLVTFGAFRDSGSFDKKHESLNI